LKFDGVDDKVESTYNPDVQQHTFEVWFNTSNDFSSKGVLIGKNLNEGQIRFESDNKIHAYVSDGSLKSVASNDTLNDGKWHQAVFVVDGGNNIELYVDGNSQSSKSVGSINTQSQGLNLGYEEDNNSKYYKGFISSAKAYEKVLSSSEVSDLYNGDFVGDGLAVDWKMRSGSGDSIYDTYHLVPNYADNSTDGGAVTWSENFSINLGDKSALDGLNEFTVSAWVRTDSSTEDLVVGSKGLSWLLKLNTDISFNNYVGLFVEDSSGNLINLQNDAVFNDGIWHQVTGVYDGADLVLYKDGVEEARKNIGDITLSTNDLKALIGHRDNSINYFEGQMDEFRFYDRALTGSEVSDLYNGEDVATGLLVKHQFEERKGITFRDTSNVTEGESYQAALMNGYDSNYFQVSENSKTEDLASWENYSWMFNLKPGARTYGGIFSVQFCHYGTPWQDGGFIWQLPDNATLPGDLKWRNGTLNPDGSNNTTNYGPKGSIDPYNWVHAAGVTKDSGNAELFLDGVSQGSQNSLGQTTSGKYGNNLDIGSYQSREGDLFNGGMEEVMFFPSVVPQESIDYARNNSNFSDVLDGVYARWSFDEGISDLEGNVTGGSRENANDLVLKNSPSWISGKVGQYALSFDASSYQYGAIDNYSMNTKGIEELTVMCWIRTTDDDMIIGSFDRSEYYRLGVGSRGTANKLTFGLVTNDGSGNSQTEDLSSSADVNDGNWHHLCVVFENGDLRMYIDGAHDSTFTTTYDLLGSGNEIYGFLGIGSEADVFDGRTGPNALYNGDLDNYRQFRKALTFSQVGWYYKNGSGSEKARPQGLQLNYEFREGSGSTAFDIKDGVKGYDSGGAAFDGRTDRLNYSSPPGIKPNKIGWSVWVYVPEEAFSMGSNAVGDTGGTLLQVDRDSVQFWPDVSKPNISASGLDILGWTHVVAQYDFNNNVGEIFVNGKKVKYSSIQRSARFWDKMRIGSYQSSRHFLGGMDDLRIYIDSMLSEDEVKEMFLSNAKLYYPMNCPRVGNRKSEFRDQRSVNDV